MIAIAIIMLIVVGIATFTTMAQTHSDSMKSIAPRRVRRSRRPPADEGCELTRKIYEVGKRAVIAIPPHHK
jgi:hypothetical protein